jgi:hypothetical protein
VPENALRRNDHAISRRSLLQSAGLLGLAASTMGALDALAFAPERADAAVPTSKPDIQFDIGNYIAPAQTMNGVVFRFAPVYTTFATFALTRTPTTADQAALAQALSTIETQYAWSPSGAFVFVAYGLPYFNRLRSQQIPVDRQLPRLLADRSRFAIEEAVPSPTDVSRNNPGVTKQTFNIPVRIESNDVLVIVRSDSRSVISDILAYLGGSSTLNHAQVAPAGLRGLLQPTSSRLMFTQPGLPRAVANAQRLPYAGSINPTSPMWMGFADQQVSGAGPAQITTFAGNGSARLTTASAGDYFDNGAIVHLSHVIEDLAQFYANPDEPYTERCQYMFRSDPIPSLGNKDQFTDGGGPSSFENTFLGSNDAARNAMGINTFQNEHRMGHLAALQRSSRASDGTPMHIRADGPGFDSLDVPNGTSQPKLQFCVFVPTADFFATMRRNQASLDLVAKYDVDPDDNGLERFITATRRQNFLVPPRRHRAFPLVELGGWGGGNH